MKRFRIIPGGRRRRFFQPRDLQLGMIAFAAVLILGLLFKGAPSAILGAVPRPLFEQSGASTERIDLRTIDGDTLEVRGSGERIRLPNIDAPEAGSRAQCRAERAAAAAAKDAAQRFVANAERIEVRRTGRTDSYGRTIGFVVLDGRDLGQSMRSSGHARPWRGRREPWCAADGSLIP